jgi:GntR family transcriptional regulator/MocR family aminotransferase
LGFLIAPAALQERLVAARRAADQHPPPVDQAVVADFIIEGHFARHLRRMRAAYAERLNTLVAAVDRYCGGALRVRPVPTGLHAVADLGGVDAGAVAREAAARDVEATPMGVYCARPAMAPNSLVLGFAAVDPPSLGAGAQRLAAAIESARRHS